MKSNGVADQGSPGKLWCVRAVAILVAALLLVHSAWYSCRWTKPGIVYVSTQGSFYGDGSSPGRAFRTIQRALDEALPGDVILIDDGVYCERLHARRSGTEDRPITLRAKNPGKVVVSWEQPIVEALRGKWSQGPIGTFTAKTKWPIYRLQLAGADLYRVPYGGLKQLESLVGRPGAYSCFCYEDQILTMWLAPADRDRLSEVVSHCRVAAPREWGEFRSANLMITGNCVVVEGIDFRMGIGASVMLSESDNVEISECAFSGATYGVYCLTPRRQGLALSVRKSIYHNYPQCDWFKDWLTWGELYGGYPSSTLVFSCYDHVQVSQNVATHVGDGIRVSNHGRDASSESVMQHNLIARATDDAFEIEGAAVGVKATENVVFDAYVGLGLSPVEQGPVQVIGNLFLHPIGGVNGTQVKIMNRMSSLDPVIRNITIDANCFVGKGICFRRGVCEDVLVRKNVFVVEEQDNSVWPPGVALDDNDVVVRDSLQGADEVTLEESSAELAGQLRTAGQIREYDFQSLERSLSDWGPAWWPMQSHAATANVFEEIQGLRKALEIK